MPGPVYTVEQLEQIALARNPTLVQTARRIEEARALRLQSGLYPNPVVGYTGEEVRGGSYRGGQQGFFLEQPVVLGGKLALNRKIGDQGIQLSVAQAEAQRHRVLNSVRMLFYRVLASQQMLMVKRDFVRIAQRTLRLSNQLHNVGQTDETEVLQARVEVQRMEIAAAVEQNTLRREWLMLANAVGDPTLPPGSLAGSLDGDLPDLDEERFLASLLTESPLVKEAQAAFRRAEFVLTRQKREPIPDLRLRGGLQQNNEMLDGARGRSVGLQGFAEIGVALRLWNRNQGNIAAAQADLERARQELRRLELTLRDASAATLQSYRNARVVAEAYRGEILPSLRRAYELMTNQYGLMTASFLRVLNLQRTLFEAELGYVASLQETWMNTVALRGFLLTGGLSVPDMNGTMDGANPVK